MCALDVSFLRKEGCGVGWLFASLSFFFLSAIFFFWWGEKKTIFAGSFSEQHNANLKLKEEKKSGYARRTLLDGMPLFSCAQQQHRLADFSPYLSYPLSDAAAQLDVLGQKKKQP